MQSLVTCLVLVLAFGSVAAQETSSPLRDIQRGADYASTVDWENGYVEVVGEATCDPSLSVNQGHCYTMALKAARALAYEKLAETVHGLHVSSSNTFEDEVIKNTTLRTAVNGLIQNARIVSEEQTVMPDGSPLVRVRLGILISGPQGLGAAVFRHGTTSDVPPDVAKLRSDLERAIADLNATKQHAQRLETLVQQASQAAQDARQAAMASGDSQTATRALEQAAAALRIAEEARKAADDVALRAAETQRHQAQGASSEEVRQAQAAAQEAREIANRLAKAAEDAQAAANEARAANASVGEQARVMADALQRSQDTIAQVDAARTEADGLRKQNEEALARLSQAQDALAADNVSATQALAEARQAAQDARQAREHAVALDRQLYEARLAVDSLTARSAATREVEISRLAAETQRLTQELAATRQRQEQLESQFDKGTTAAMSGVQSGDKAVTQALTEARQAADEARRARERADALERQLAEARQAVDALAAKPSTVREAEVVRLANETKHLADELASARKKQTTFEQQTTEAMSRLSKDDDTALSRALEEARQASKEAKAAREQAVALERQLTQAKLATEATAAKSSAERDAQIEALGTQTRRLAEELASTRVRQAELEKGTTAAMSQATKALEQAGSRQPSPEVTALVADLNKSLAQTQQLQSAVAALEQRAASAEAEAARMREMVGSSTATRSDVSHAMEQAAVASRAVQALRDSLKSSPASPPAAPTVASVARAVELGKTPYTGLIVDASYLGVRPALKARVYSPDGDEVYGESKASRSTLAKMGKLTGYSDTPETARTKHVGLIGKNPLVVKAVEATGGNKSDVVVSREDALLIERADRSAGFLKDCKVTITVEPTA